MSKRSKKAGPATPPAAPAPKATPLTILKVRRTRKHVVIRYRNGNDTHNIECSDMPLPAFDNAIAALAPLVCELIKVPASYVENMRAVGLTITDGSGNEQVTIIAAKSLDDANGPLNIATPLRLMDLPEAEGSYSQPLGANQVALIDEVVEQAKAYVLGERAQGQIEFKKEDEDADDDDADTAPLEFEHESAAAAR
jgi:hypothetical protein